MTEPLRPFTLGEILDRTAQLYRRNFLLFAGVAAVPAASILVVLIPFIGMIALPLRAAAKGGTPQSATMVALLMAMGVVVIPVAIAATVVSQAGLVRSAIAAHMGQKLRIREAIKSVWPRFWRYLGVMIMQGIMAGLIPAVIAGVVVGLLFFLTRLAGGGVAANAGFGFFTFIVVTAMIVVIVIRALSYSLSLPACVVEDKPIWQSLQRSLKLSKGTRGRIFLMFLLVYALSVIVSIIGYIPVVIVTAVAALMGHGGATSAVLIVIGEIVNVLVNFALQTLITPVYIVALVLFYYDQRIRTEGYDIEWMMERAGLTGAEAPRELHPGQGTTAGEPAADAGTLNG
jgi:hypothetical protein